MGTIRSSKPPTDGGYRVIPRPSGVGSTPRSTSGGGGGRRIEIEKGDLQEYKDYQQVYLGGGGVDTAGVQQQYHYPAGGGGFGDDDDDDDCGGEFGGYSSGYYSQVGH